MQIVRGIKKSYFNRIFFLFFVFSLALVMTVSIIISLAFYQMYSSNIHAQTQSTTDNIGNTIEKLVADYSNVLIELEADANISSFISGEQGVESEIIKELYFVKNSYPEKAEISIIRLEGNQWISTKAHLQEEPVSKYNNWGVFRKAKASTKAAVYAVAKDAILDEEDRIILGKAARNASGQVQGYLLVEIPRATIQGMVSEYTNLYHTDLMIVNKSGSIIYHSEGTDKEGLGRIEEYGGFDTLRQSEDREWTWNKYSCHFSKDTGLYVLQEIPSNAMETILHTIVTAFICSIGVIMLLGFVVSTLVAKSIAYPIQEMKETMSRVKHGDLSARVQVIREDEIGQLGNSFNSMAGRIEELMVNVDEEKHSLWIAETRSLNLQMNPHFLYNTLDLIKWNAKLGRTKEIADITVNLAKLLRKIMNTKEELVPLSYEMEIITAFIEIQKKHYGDELHLVTELSEGMLKEKIPKLTLQPIVENAIVHGFAQKAADCIITIFGKMEGEYLVFLVEDNGGGIEQQELSGILNFRQDNTHHIGLNNVDRRAKLYGDGDCGICVSSRLHEGTRVHLKMRRLRGE